MPFVSVEGKAPDRIVFAGVGGEASLGGIPISSLRGSIASAEARFGA